MVTIESGSAVIGSRSILTCSVESGVVVVLPDEAEPPHETSAMVADMTIIFDVFFIRLVVPDSF